MSIKTKSAKQKGRDFQKWTMDQLHRFLAKPFSLRYGDFGFRSMGAQGVDIMMSPKAMDVFPFSIECKCTKNHPSLQGLLQAQHNAYDGTIGVVIWKPFRARRDQSLIYMNFQEFLKMVVRLRQEGMPTLEGVSVLNQLDFDSMSEEDRKMIADKLGLVVLSKDDAKKVADAVNAATEAEDTGTKRRIIRGDTDE